MWRTFSTQRASVLVVRRDQAVGGQGGRQLAGQECETYVVADRANPGRAAQALVELVADEGPGEVELLLGALGGQACSAQERAVRQDPLPDLVDPGTLEARAGQDRRHPALAVTTT